MTTNQVLQRDLEERMKRLNEIGAALSLERDLTVLLERILLEARGFTLADAGTLYLIKDEHLHFEIAQNDTLRSFMGGSHGPANVPPVPLNKASASGYAAVTGETLNIEDVYTDEKYRFEGPKQYDLNFGYRTRSLLVVPMRDHEGQVIGVLQLLNAKHAQTGDPVAFTPEDQDLLQSLASQAAVAINNVRLIKETEQLFESFVQVMATAIDERSPYTGGHIRRVMEMAMVVAGAVNACESGPFAGVCFSDDELEEFRIAAWMHDIGKITTPEWVVDKPTKLTTIFNRIELLEVRLKFIKQSIQIERLEKEVALLQVGAGLPSDLAQEYDRRLAELDDEIAFLVRANTPGEFMEKADLERVQAIGCKTYLDGGEEKPYLTANEIENLSIDRGTLTEAERQKIQNHAAMSIKMLAQIPFTRKLQQVPPIAGAHHERLNGKGYPLGLKGDEIGLQARILALVDIFESISADDRPYRKKAPQDVVLRILQEEVDKNHLDSALLDLFLEEKLYLKLDEIKEKMAREKQSAEQSAGD